MTPDDIDAIVALMPRPAAFDVPAHRDPKDLWEGGAMDPGGRSVAGRQR